MSAEIAAGVLFLVDFVVGVVHFAIRWLVVVWWLWLSGVFLVRFILFK